MRIEVEVRTVYGQALVYPLCERAKALIKLTGRKTFSHRDLQALEAAGVTIDNR